VPDATRTLGETLLEVNRRNECLIDGLLVLAKGEQRLETHATVDLADIAHRVITTAGPDARAAGILIHSDLLHAYVIGDPALLERLAQNLVDNAIHYNIAERGWVHVSATGDTQYSRLVVANTGPVVAPSEIDALFEPFRRLASSERTTAANQPVGNRGAGLGLSIVRSVATAHSGDVRAEARPDGGLVVTVTLPFRQ
jgi:signal transduction histidine kinase